MSRQRPLILVTGPRRGGFVPWQMARLAVRRAGGRAVRMHIGRQAQDVPFDGLVVGGGSDISPEHYGQEVAELARDDKRRSPLQRLVDVLLFLVRILFSIKFRQPARDPERDAMEKALINRALETGRPVLGICRGEQMLNVALGGSLHQDTSEFYSETPDVQSIRPVKDVTIEPGSRLAAALQTDRLRVNALHSQAVADLGKGIRVSARDGNGIVQAIEHEGREFVIGVQWHPEYLPRHGVHQRLFRGLVAAARRRE